MFQSMGEEKPGGYSLCSELGCALLGRVKGSGKTSVGSGAAENGQFFAAEGQRCFQ